MAQRKLVILSLVSIGIWSLCDPLRDVLWDHPSFHPGTPYDLWHLCKYLTTYSTYGCLLWWMWPLCGWRRQMRARPYISFTEDEDGEIVPEYYDQGDDHPSSTPYITDYQFWRSYRHALYWLITAAASWLIWRSVIALAGGW